MTSQHRVPCAAQRALASLALLLVCCTRSAPPREPVREPVGQGGVTPSARDVVLSPQPGERPIDQRIRAQQERVRRSKVVVPELERLGLMFLARARELEDPGGYTLALSTASAMQELESGSRAALLLRGMALHGLHRFSEAEVIARTLVAARGLPTDVGLLGDVLSDRGALDEAITTYQRMVDMRPDQHAYARAAHVRFLKGDVRGAAQAMTLATRAASPRNRESFAWAYAKLASYQLQLGELHAARAAIRRAREVFPESGPALKSEAQISMFEGALEAALVPLREAIARSPHPELLWMEGDALEALGRGVEAADVRARLRASGAQEDPRAYALYLASRGESLAEAQVLAQRELAERRDIYSYEALGWVQSARGQHAEALTNVRRALAEGTEDARLFYHAGMIAARAHQDEDARRWLSKASALSGMLLPSQRARLAAQLTAASP